MVSIGAVYSLNANVHVDGVASFDGNAAAFGGERRGFSNPDFSETYLNFQRT